ncbi:acid shock protein [Hydrogenoanaerobacterium sp.]|uniref:acid shock protein n=1 Tax=Hydrogenoanaerobacterium sp. TaxID=2953763 RepID=UPI0028968CB8|nr:acid shock protein [Hydrogenoanaerobacterium sp.]
MKKVLSLVLAAVMCFGMSTVAFAAKDSKPKKIAVFDSGFVFYTFDDDDSKNAMNPAADKNSLNADETYYIHVTEEDGTEITKLSDLDNFKVRSSIDDGAAYISSKPSFVIKTVKEIDGAKLPKSEKMAFITFTTADKFNMEEKSLDMEIKLYGDDNNCTTKVGTETAAKEATIDSFTSSEVKYGETEAKTYVKVDGPIVKFDDIDDDCELEFGDDEITFFVNAKDQKDLFLRLDDSDDALEDKYPNADLQIVYFAGNNKAFRRNGTLTIPSKAVEGKEGKLVAPHIYEKNNGKLSVCKDAKYDDDKEAFIIKTNKLGNYVISDIELDVKDTATDDKGEGTEKNPDTGANDFVGLAVALAVVSVAGIAVAKRK